MRVWRWVYSVLVGACGGSPATPDAPIDDATPPSEVIVDAPDEVTCTSTAAPGLVFVEIEPTGADLNTHVYFHGPDGKQITKTIGDSSATVPPCSSVTFAYWPSGNAPSDLSTVTDVHPGDTIRWGASGVAFTDTRSVRIDFPPTGRPIEFYGGHHPLCEVTSASTPVTFSMPRECEHSVTDTADFLAIDRINDVPVAFAIASIAPTDTGTITAWRTDFQSVTKDIVNAPAGWSAAVNISLLHDGRMADLRLQATSVPATLALPPFGDRAFVVSGVRGPIASDEGLIGIDIAMQPIAPSSFDVAAEVPFRVTALDVAQGTRPYVTWATAATPSNADIAILCMQRSQAPTYWCIYMDPLRKSMRVPVMPMSDVPGATIVRTTLIIDETSSFAGYATLRPFVMDRVGKTGIRYPSALRMRTAYRSVAL